MLNSKLLKSKMVEAGYTQRVLAKKLDITEGTLSRKMRRARPFTVDEAQTLCNVLGISNGEEITRIFFG